MPHPRRKAKFADRPPLPHESHRYEAAPENTERRKQETLSHRAWHANLRCAGSAKEDRMKVRIEWCKP